MEKNNLKQGVEWGKPNSSEWKKACLKTHGKLLNGKQSHYCWDWDCMPVDETCVEFECCTCFS
jgi:hypothetical protein